MRIQLCGGWWGDEGSSEVNMYGEGRVGKLYGQFRIFKITHDLR